MEPVRITDVKKWSSIDIFLFSNGQQYSPPRKYHLRSEELQWWGATLNYLGRTQYGAGHSSIELYAISGTKINGPLELMNGAAYVAVEPPDSFINTGYEDYLLKASRSWEKRLAQKSYNTETSKQDLKREKDPDILSNTDNLKAPDILTDAAPLKVGSNGSTMPQKTRPTKPYQRIQRKSITSPKQFQKKKSFDTHSAIIKKLCAEKDKLVPCPKKMSIKNNGRIIKKTPTVMPCKPNEIINQEPSSCCKKSIPLKPESNPKTETQAPNKNPELINLFSSNQTEIMSLENDSELYPIHLRCNQNNEQRKLNTDSAKTLNGFTHKNETYKDSHKVKQMDEFEKSDFAAKNDLTGDSQVNTPIINNIKENKSHDTLLNSRSEKQVIDEYVAQMNKGGVILLKLKVKLKDCKSIFNRDKNKNIKIDTLLTNLPKTEKTSQVDINISFSGELLKPDDQQYIQDKSLQSLLNKLYSEETDQVNTRNPRIIILQCACRDYANNLKSCMCDVTQIQGNEVEDKKFDTTSNLKLNEASASCECYDEPARIPKVDHTLKLDNKNETIKDMDDRRISLSNGTRVKDLAQRFERSNGIMSNDKNNNSNNRPINKNHKQPVVLTRLFGSQIQKHFTENQIGEENNDANSKSICDKSTQTDWCNVLLEARLHEDDRYTFHLPSLYLLKRYNL